LQPKTSLNKQLETSLGWHDRLLNCQLAEECKNFLNGFAPMCTPAQEKQPPLKKS
jgi:hypothetical protein